MKRKAAIIIKLSNKCIIILMRKEFQWAQTSILVYCLFYLWFCSRNKTKYLSFTFPYKWTIVLHNCWEKICGMLGPACLCRYLISNKLNHRTEFNLVCGENSFWNSVDEKCFCLKANYYLIIGFLAAGCSLTLSCCWHYKYFHNVLYLYCITKFICTVQRVSRSVREITYFR